MAFVAVTLTGSASVAMAQANVAPTAVVAPAGQSAAPAGFDARREEIPRGTIESVEYDSTTVGGKRKVVVYTPPGYSKSSTYPVLYLLHGIGDDETGWWKKGSAETILDNLHADKKLVPMIVVMPNGRASATPVTGNPMGGNVFADFANFENDLLKDLIPFIQANYSVKPGNENRALAGLSMGGGQTLNFGFAHLETFPWMGAFSSAPNTKPPAELVAAVSAAISAGNKPRLLWISCGDKDGLMNVSLGVHNALEAAKIAHVWYVDSGAHTWPVWKNDLYLFSQELFKPPVR